MEPTDLRRHFGVVLQDPHLFSGTIEGNIRLGTTWIEEEHLVAAAEQVNLLEYIQSLPMGFSHPVNERGAGISTGQKQLIGFARALAHNPQFLILDEATSSVDTETEQKLRDAVATLVEGRTSIIIAHRLSTVRNADKIIVTTDNPRHEDPQKIVDEVMAGFSSVENVEAVLDRRQAIDIAITNAQPGDVVLLAGKGHETSQIVGDVHIAFDDRRVAREFLSARESGVL